MKLFFAMSLVVASASLAFAAQEKAPAIERATAWPKLEGEALSNARTDVERLRKAHTDEMGAQAEAALVSAGAGAVPEILPVLGKERDAEAVARVRKVLDQLTTAAHTRLLAAEFASKSREVRTWALKRCSQFPDVELRTQAEAALAAARKAKPKSDEREEVEAVKAEVYAAALCATSTGSTAGFADLEGVALDHWGKRGVEIRAALEALRGNKEVMDRAGKLAFDKDRKKSVAGLNLLAGCGSKDALNLVKPHLDSTDNTVRIAAINAMRGIVDGDPPLDKLAVFEAIELAKKWKDKS